LLYVSLLRIFSDQHRLIAQTADDFCNNEIVPNADKMEHKDFSSPGIVKEGCDLGSLGGYT